MKIEIKPSILSGSVEIPPSKSYSHRAIIAAALSNKNKKSKIENIIFSDDIETTIKIMENFGATIKKNEKSVEIFGNNGNITIQNQYIQCNESGSSIRFLMPLALVNKNEIIFDGKGKLIERPLHSYYKIFEKQKIFYETTNGNLPVKIKGKLNNGIYEVDGNISSQFITGLLYTLPLLEGDSKLIINKNLESKGYVDLTLKMLELAGIKIINNNYKSFNIKGKQQYNLTNYRVEGDYSQVAFWIVAGIISSNINNEIKCLYMNKDSLQGDKEIINIVKKMGAKIDFFEDNIIIKPCKTKGTVIDVAQCPDIAPILVVLAALSEGESQIINGERLRIKESDRLTAIRTELNKLGAKIEEIGDSLLIKGVENFEGGVEVSGWNDHRIVMSLAIASTKCKKNIVINDAENVKKSYPHFWEDFEKMGGDIKKVK